MEFIFGQHVLDVDRRELRRGVELIAVEPQVFDILVYLVQNRDRVVSKDNLLEAVWGGRVVSESTLTSSINAVRKAVGDSGKAQGLIRTVPRRGVRFVDVVCEREPAAPVDPRSMAAEDPESPTGFPSTKKQSPQRLSIIVLPFVNLSDDQEQEYFADGITDDLTTDLSHIPGSFVVARSTAFTYKGTPVDVRQIGRDLGVRYILEGSVRRAGDKVQVNVQLVDAESGAHLSADRFDTNRANLAEAQNEIAGRLARTLHLELVGDASRRIDQERAVSPDARDLVMRGWAWYYQPRSATTAREAQEAFERALKVDPRSIDAKIGIARLLLVNLIRNYDIGWSHSINEDGARAEQLLLEAIESDPNRSIARSSMGQLRRVQNRLTESRIEYETAIALDPNDDFAHVQLGWTLLFLGQPGAAMGEGEKALRLSPRDPQIWGKYLQLGWCQFLLYQCDAAIDLLIKSRAANPRTWVTHFALAGALGLKGDLDGANAALAELLKVKPEVNSLAQFCAYRPWGNPQYWRLYEKTAAVGLRRTGFLEK
jgi:adenylate cyclase